jgi:two-component system, cell cycle response regulator DivK
MTAGPSILIIDDDARNIFALSAVLRSRGYEIISATSAMKGLEILQGKTGIKVVLLDMMMPEMDGYETIGEIRKIPACKNIPVLAVTAQAMVGDRERVIKAGADDYVSKPIDLDLLLNLLERYKADL